MQEVHNHDGGQNGREHAKPSLSILLIIGPFLGPFLGGCNLASKAVAGGEGLGVAESATSTKTFLHVVHQGGREAGKKYHINQKA